MHLAQLLYMSKPIAGTTQHDVDQIIESSRINNPKNGITGVMFYNRKFYLQCLEGGRTAINTLYNKIVKDSRHSDCRLFLFRDIACRDFAKWDMNYIGEGIVNHDVFYKHATTHDLNFDHMSHNTAFDLMLELAEEHGKLAP